MCGSDHLASLDFSAVSFFVPLVHSCSAGMFTRKPFWWSLSLSGITIPFIYLVLVSFSGMFGSPHSGFRTKPNHWPIRTNVDNTNQWKLETNSRNWFKRGKTRLTMSRFLLLCVIGWVTAARFWSQSKHIKDQSNWRPRYLFTAFAKNYNLNGRKNVEIRFQLRVEGSMCTAL